MPRPWVRRQHPEGDPTTESTFASISARAHSAPGASRDTSRGGVRSSISRRRGGRCAAERTSPDTLAQRPGLLRQQGGEVDRRRHPRPPPASRPGPAAARRTAAAPRGRALTGRPARFSRQLRQERQVFDVLLSPAIGLEPHRRERRPVAALAARVEERQGDRPCCHDSDLPIVCQGRRRRSPATRRRGDQPSGCMLLSSTALVLPYSSTI